MSWGERSCIHKPCIIPDECSYETCNVDCRCYKWNGLTTPDSVSATSKKSDEVKQQSNTLKTKWDKKKGNKLFRKEK